MKIDELILRLEGMKQEHGNITVCIAKSDDIWGCIYTEVENIFNFGFDGYAQPKGPKSGEVVKAVVFRY